MHACAHSCVSAPVRVCVHKCAYIWYTRMYVHAANAYSKKHICGPSIATVHYAIVT